MFCNKCGKPMEAGARFCPMCGTAHEGTATRQPFAGAFRGSGQLVRSRARRMIGGVCAGFADHYGWDLTVVRLITVAITLFTGLPVLVYIAAWIIIPDGQYALPFGAPAVPPPPSGPSGTTAL